jgi:hypothetical protein
VPAPARAVPATRSPGTSGRWPTPSGCSARDTERGQAQDPRPRVLPGRDGPDELDSLNEEDRQGIDLGARVIRSQGIDPGLINSEIPVE